MEKTQVLIPSPVLIDDSHQQQIHVLAVDDSLVDRKVIERLLKISSCKVTAVDSGWRALQYLGLDGEKNPAESNDLKVNLIITDYWMPGMTGYELLKKIKESSTFKEIPVVIMSSENVLPRINRCLEEGAEDFIVKPVKLSDVKRLKDNIKREEKRDDDDVHHHHHDHHHDDDHHDQARGQKRKLNEVETQDGHYDEDHHDDGDTLVSLPSSSPSSSPLDSRRQKTTNETV